MMIKRACVSLAAVLLILAGCQTTGPAPREKDAQANNYLVQAQAYENEGNLVEALEQFKRAQALEPESTIINESIQRLETRLQQLAETHYQAGLRFRDKGKWDLAQKEFLKALAYWPDHQDAAAMLQQREPQNEQAYITHIIGPGESLSKLAIKYYGDYRKYHHIANFNHMTDATQVRIGQKIMVPTIDGVGIEDLNRISAGGTPQAVPGTIDGEYAIHQIAPGESLSQIAKMYYGDYKLFRVIADYNGIADPTSVRVGQKIKVPRLEGYVPAAPTGDRQAAYQPEAQPADKGSAAGMLPAPGPTPEPLPAEAAEPAAPDDQVAEYRESGIALFNEGNYDDAIVELTKVLSAAPDDAPAKSYLSRAFVEKGRRHLDAGEIDDAKRALATALDYDPDCQPCKALLEKSRSAESEALVAQGEQLFKQNQFTQAVVPIERALKLDPDSRRAKELLFQTHFQEALIRYNSQDYMPAKDGFERALAVNPDCGECKTYIANSLNAYTEHHYNEGIVFFGREALKEAIDAWEKVAAVDPGYKDVQRNLEKARLLHERLERIKSGTD